VLDLSMTMTLHLLPLLLLLELLELLVLVLVLLVVQLLLPVLVLFLGWIINSNKKMAMKRMKKMRMKRFPRRVIRKLVDERSRSSLFRIRVDGISLSVREKRV
jgi:hypothetical protein